MITEIRAGMEPRIGSGMKAAMEVEIKTGMKTA